MQIKLTWSKIPTDGRQTSWLCQQNFIAGSKSLSCAARKRYKLVIFLSAFLFHLHLTSVSCHVTVYFQRDSIVLGVDPVLPVSFRIPRVPDVLTGMSSIMRVPTFCFDWKQKERDKDKKSLEFEMCWKLRLSTVVPFLTDFCFAFFPNPSCRTQT